MNNKFNKGIYMRFAILIFMFMLVACSSCNTARTAPDTQTMTAIAAGDLTALIQGCGNQLVSGYTYCRKVEGDNTTESVVFVIPTSKCGEDSCAEVKIFFPDGSPTYGYVFKKGETIHRVKWADLTKKSTFDIDDRGFWPFTYRIKYIDKQGKQRETVTEGEIRLRILRKGYTPLHEISEDMNFVWKFQYDGVDVKMTTGGRTYVSERNIQ
jgi:hypothetical protein